LFLAMRYFQATRGSRLNSSPRRPIWKENARRWLTQCNSMLELGSNVRLNRASELLRERLGSFVYVRIWQYLVVVLLPMRVSCP
jgi:hypothetical protein